MTKKLNRDQKRAKKAGLVSVFVQQYARKSCPHTDPNDRRYDREVEAAVKRLPADELDRLLREDEDEDSVQRTFMRDPLTAGSAA